MKERVQLFLDNMEKIRLYFGTGTDNFTMKIATQLTVRGIRFCVSDYEEIKKEIKANSKWYSTIRVSKVITNAYYIQFAKEPEKVAQTLEMQKLITSTSLSNIENSYLAAMYIKNRVHAVKMDELSNALLKQPSLKFSTLSLVLRAMLATRPESAVVLANTYEHYYKHLVDFNFIRGDESKSAALLLTMGTGTFDEKTWQRVRSFTTTFMSTNAKLEPRHYSVVCLLALATFETQEFQALTEVHETICQALKLNPKYYNTLLIATQIYTCTEGIGELPKCALDFSDIVLQGIDGVADSASGDGGGGE
ncbi:DUF4003 family protein [Lysinibacillus sp. NPDC097287]|uniref:DUF4003 family protein n=1 Tax=Lysinibacillus sp. NPDC097287 TaxID=3364144 RepID=UPI0037F5981E